MFHSTIFLAMLRATKAMATFAKEKILKGVFTMKAYILLDYCIILLVICLHLIWLDECLDLL